MIDRATLREAGFLCMLVGIRHQWCISLHHSCACLPSPQPLIEGKTKYEDAMY